MYSKPIIMQLTRVLFETSMSYGSVELIKFNFATHKSSQNYYSAGESFMTLKTSILNHISVLF